MNVSLVKMGTTNMFAQIRAALLGIFVRHMTKNTRCIRVFFVIFLEKLI